MQYHVFHLSILTTIALATTGCKSRAVDEQASAPKLTILGPASKSVIRKDQETIEFSAYCDEDATAWAPGVLVMELTGDRQGKMVEANSVVKPVMDKKTHRIIYKERYQKPKSKGAYFIHATLYEDTSGAPSKQAEARTSKLIVVEIEVER